jgi:hypothetical protein
MSRRSKPPRARKSRSPEGPRRDAPVIIPPNDAPPESLAHDARDATGPSMSPPPLDAELAELDAGWD